MKSTLTIISLFLVFTSHAQTIIPDSAKNYIGKEVTVCGDVKGTYTSKSDGTIFLNFGHDYPDQVFSVVIFSDNAKKFSQSPATMFKAKNVCVTGTIQMYKSKPEIAVSKVEQIKLK